jgi:SAM-dependent methyltransferase
MESARSHEMNADQVAYWNGPGGQRWADRQQHQDVVFAPVSAALIDCANVKNGERIIDVGCGCGAISISLAQKTGPTGHVVGVDVSAPMLARARQIAPPDLPLEFAPADATIYPFVLESFDLVVSRFGVMFFAEPVLAFTNLNRSLRRSGRLAFACWQEPRKNPFFVAPLQAAYKHAPRLPQPGPDEPGPFSFASEQRVRRILEQAGFSGIEMEPCEVSLDLAAGRGLDAAVQSALEIGPAARALAEQSPAVVDAARNSIREALVPFVRGETVQLAASIWLVTATRS